MSNLYDLLKRVILLMLVAVTILVLPACDDDDLPDVDSSPQFMNAVVNQSAVPGSTVVFSAEIQDDAGISAINIKYSAWHLDKTISLDSLQTTFQLNYKFKVPESSALFSEHVIEVTATNVGGKFSSQNFVVALDQDVTAPVMVVNRPVDGVSAQIGPDKEVVFDIDLSDDRGLEIFTIKGEGIDESIMLEGTEYKFTGSLDLTTPGSYGYELAVADTSGNTTSTSVTVNIIENLQFDKMYVTGVGGASQLTNDLFGEPMRMDDAANAEDQGFVFTANYYSPDVNSEVRFIPQTTSFEPFTFGASAADDGKLVIGNSNDIAPVVLNEKGYYLITIDLRSLTYTVEAYTPTDPTFSAVYLLGTGVLVNGSSTCVDNIDESTRCWHFQSGKPLMPDPDNPYRFSAEITLFDDPDNGGSNGFILNANPEGWSPFWRFDNGTSPERTIPNGGDNFTFTEGAHGTYDFTFDTHLNVVTVIRK